jgi:hypothetical protein
LRLSVFAIELASRVTAARVERIRTQLHEIRDRGRTSGAWCTRQPSDAQQITPAKDATQDDVERELPPRLDLLI